MGRPKNALPAAFLYVHKNNFRFAWRFNGKKCVAATGIPADQPTAAKRLLAAFNAILRRRRGSLPPSPALLPGRATIPFG